jgi:S-adenosyl-L-methionine hydrolase (adenosine-forming)
MIRGLTTNYENHQPHSHETRHPRLLIAADAGIQAEIPAPSIRRVTFGESLPSRNGNAMNPPIITLLSDFGLSDGYVASMKGAILGICPSARLVDVTHLVPPQDVRAGAFLLANVVPDFPEGTVHLAVVDPGVGTGRKPIAVRTSRGFLVGPDNGLFSLVLEKETKAEARAIENPAYRHPKVSKTFHGRDIFAPAAAHLASGVPFEEFGPVCTPKIAHWSRATATVSELRGEIIHIDRFGNAISNIGENMLREFAAKGRTEAGIRRRRFPLVSTYGDLEPGTLMALIGSSGYLEVAVNQGSAAEKLRIIPGEPIRVFRSS